MGSRQDPLPSAGTGGQRGQCPICDIAAVAFSLGRSWDKGCLGHEACLGQKQVGQAGQSVLAALLCPPSFHICGGSTALCPAQNETLGMPPLLGPRP